MLDDIDEIDEEIKRLQTGGGFHFLCGAVKLGLDKTLKKKITCNSTTAGPLLETTVTATSKKMCVAISVTALYTPRNS